jgi:hypothetical protein
MTVFRPKLWTSVGAAVLLAGGVAACSGEGGECGEAGATPPAAGAAGEGGEGGVEKGAAPTGEGGEGGAESGGAASAEAGAEAAYTGVPEESRRALRLAHLKGFFLAAQAAQPVQGAEAAAALAGQGMLEVFDPAAGNFRAAGVDEATLRKAAQSGDAGAVRAAIAAIEAAQQRAGGDPAAVARGMTSIAAGLYRGVITEGAVDAVEYQHAYGAALSARDLAARNASLAPAKADIDKLARLWPSPVAPDTPAQAPSLAQVQAQASRIELALSGA